MPKATVKKITFANPSWINRELQQFCGSYYLDHVSGLYFDGCTPVDHRTLISRNFRKLPSSLQAAAHYLELTVSTTSFNGTKSGAQSAVYGDWERDDPKRIAPHLEMSNSSLNAELVLPHLAHECAHLFWAIQSKQSRAEFIDQMLELVESDDFVEVTVYAQGYFDEWRKLCKMTGYGMAQRVRRALEKWIVEAFCETVAKLWSPDYKAEEQLEVDDLLQLRLTMIEATFDLELAPKLVLLYG